MLGPLPGSVATTVNETDIALVFMDLHLTGRPARDRQHTLKQTLLQQINPQSLTIQGNISKINSSLGDTSSQKHQPVT